MDSLLFSSDAFNQTFLVLVFYDIKGPVQVSRAFSLCAGYVQQHEGGSPFDNRMEVKSSLKRDIRWELHRDHGTVALVCDNQ
jgi:hypothetical protein